MTTISQTRANILEFAQVVLQRNGYGGLHFGEIASSLGVTRAAIYYYFPTKPDLARTIMEGYTERFQVRLALIQDEGGTVRRQLEAYVGLYRETGSAGEAGMCPGGMLAAELWTLPQELHGCVKHFFDVNVAWIAGVVGPDLTHTGVTDDDVESLSTRIVATLQGGLLVARVYEEPKLFEEVGVSLFSPDLRTLIQ